ncbi:MAG: methylated-DNA--[protein]-cysteine S-methyltransferase, partial [Candidatus Eremiobacteraeota bacterium]|nr:methylated-DNA--[protein]-cysteine S-methyltransferase [Candidatus Eremiobacteraeota bacterium]
FSAYFRRRLQRFELPYRVEGTSFQRAVWQTVSLLEAGEVVSYSDVARAIGRPFAQRAVAMAMGMTPLAIVIPAHRVVGADGRVKGAPTNSLRRRLLVFEGFRLRRDGTLRYEVRS